ncbi:MAG: 2-hydroxyacid dehydrogenase [Bacteroidia bacterium]
MKKKYKAVWLEEMHPSLQEILLKNNVSVLIAKNESELFELLNDSDILIVRSKKVDKHLIDNAPKLKIIGRAGSGMENIDVKYAQSKSIICLNSPEGNRDAVGEHALGMLLMLLNHLKKADNEVRQNIWDRKNNWGFEIKGSNVGIIGYGNTGSAFARKLSGFECNIFVYDKYKSDIKDSWVQKVELEEIFENADIVSLHLPLNDETLYYADEAFFERFRKSIYFINTSRGKILKTSALVNALKSGKVKVACLDVLEYEDTNFENMNAQYSEDFDYLKKSDKVILTPHIAGWTHQSYEKICRIIGEKIVKAIQELER